jgi:hypothetical protein
MTQARFAKLAPRYTGEHYGRREASFPDISPVVLLLVAQGHDFAWAPLRSLKIGVYRDPTGSYRELRELVKYTCERL